MTFAYCECMLAELRVHDMRTFHIGFDQELSFSSVLNRRFQPLTQGSRFQCICVDALNIDTLLQSLSSRHATAVASIPTEAPESFFVHTAMSDAIERLSDASVRALRSAFIITTYVSCIEELVQNAIDASATNISIYLRRDQWSCRVQDNGRGIRPTDLAKLGQRYYTSKAYTHVGLKDVNTFGFRGEALASLAESSVVHIHSRHEDSEPDQTHAIHLRVGQHIPIQHNINPY